MINTTQGDCLTCLIDNTTMRLERGKCPSKHLMFCSDKWTPSQVCHDCSWIQHTFLALLVSCKAVYGSSQKLPKQTFSQSLASYNCLCREQPFWISNWFAAINYDWGAQFSRTAAGIPIAVGTVEQDQLKLRVINSLLNYIRGLPF